MNWFTYIRYDCTKKRPFFNCPIFVVKATSITEADKMFEAELGFKPMKMPYVGVRILFEDPTRMPS